MFIRACTNQDLGALLVVVNDAAQAYRGVIPADCWHEPYMTPQDLTHEVDAGVAFWGAEGEGRLLGVMGLQDKGEVMLVRHAYVATAAQRKGIETSVVLANAAWTATRT